MKRSDDEELAELVEAWLDGGLDAQEQASLDARLADPQQAQAALRQARDALVLKACFEATPAATIAARARRILAQDQPSGQQRTIAGVQRRVQRRRRRWYLPLAIGGSLIAAGLVLALLLHGEGPPDALLDGPGLARLSHAGRTLEVTTGAGLRAGDRVEAGSEALHLSWPDGSRMELGPGASLALLSAQPKRLRLLNGALRATVAPQPVGEPLTISTSQALATVVGTRFLIDEGATGSRLLVEHGQVRFAPISSEEQAQTIAAGGMASVSAGRLVMGPTAETLDQGLWLQWRWDGVEAVADRSGQGHAGRIVHANAARGPDGQAALECTGRSAIFAAGSETFSPERFSVALWLRPAGAQAPCWLLQRQDHLAGLGFALGWSAPGRICLRLWPGAPGEEPLECSAALDTSAWIHLAGSWDGQRLALWRDGRLLAAREGQGLRATWPRGGSLAPLHPLVLGAGFVGSLGDVRVYERALDADELLRLGMAP